MSLPPPLTVEHACRISVLEPEKRWSLKGDVLWVASGEYPAMPIPLASLKEVRLLFSPTRMQRNRYQCHLYNASGRCGAFQNEHFRGMMDFEDRSASYNALVRLLASRAASVNPRCRFTTGTSWWSWLLQAGFLTSVLVLLVFVFITMGSAVTGLVVVKLLIVLFYIPTAGSWIVKNKPRVFPPGEVPAKMLPTPP